MLRLMNNEHNLIATTTTTNLISIFADAFTKSSQSEQTMPSFDRPEYHFDAYENRKRKRVRGCILKRTA